MKAKNGDYSVCMRVIRARVREEVGWCRVTISEVVGFISDVVFSTSEIVGFISDVVFSHSDGKWCG